MKINVSLNKTYFLKQLISELTPFIFTYLLEMGNSVLACVLDATLCDKVCQ
jgi:hypothetical protein